jgi:uncharacterized protein
MGEQRITESSMEAARARRAAYLAAVPPGPVEAEDKLPATVAALNASARAKLHRIYAVADQLAAARAPFVACGKGCNSCCHMNVSITSAEAERLGKAVDRKPILVAPQPRQRADRFSGQPCPFLDPTGACSVYDGRPLACRKHASFFNDAAACHPSVMNDIEVPQVAFSGLDQALFKVSTDRGELILADIRDFFPTRR